MAPLLHARSGQPVTFVGVHLKAGATTEDHTARRQQAAQLQAHLRDTTAPATLPRALQCVGPAPRSAMEQTTSDRSSDCEALVVLGDFNDGPESAPLTTLTAGGQACTCDDGRASGLQAALAQAEHAQGLAMPCGRGADAAAPLRSCWSDYATLQAAARTAATATCAAARGDCSVPLGAWLERSSATGAGAPDAIADVFTTWKFRRKRNGGGDEEKQAAIDHVLYTPAALRLAGMRRMPDAAALGECALPSRGFPSDHLPVVVRLQFV